MCELLVNAEIVDLQSIDYAVDYDDNAKQVRHHLSITLYRPMHYRGQVLRPESLQVGSGVNVVFQGDGCFFYPQGRYIIRDVEFTWRFRYWEVRLELELPS